MRSEFHHWFSSLKNAFSSFSKFVTHNNIEELTNEFEKAFYHTLRNGNSTMIMTDLALKLTKAIHKN